MMATAPFSRTFNDLVREQAAKAPNACALVRPQGRFSYSDLAERAARVAGTRLKRRACAVWASHPSKSGRAAKNILARGIKVVLFELGSCIGGLWAHNNDSGLRPAYRSLHLNSEARVTECMMDDQAEWIAELVCKDVALPEEAGMRKVMDEEQNFLRRHYPGGPRYALELDPAFCRRQLSAERTQGRTRSRPRRPSTASGPGGSSMKKGGAGVTA